MSSVTRDSRYAWVVAWTLCFIYCLSFIDRQVLNLMVQPIRTDLGLSDTRISFLQGLGFAVAYVAMGPVFGRWVDRGSRRNVMLFGAAAWSLSTALGGFAAGFWSLFASRVGVGAAEACLTPAVFSLISDYFSPSKLPRASSIYGLGSYLGSSSALLLGGAIAGHATGTIEFAGVELNAWRLSFVAAGLLGLLAIPLVLSIREPARTSAVGATAEVAPSLADVRRYLWAHRRFYLCLMFGVALMSTVSYSIQAWMPTALIRRFGLDAATVGKDLGMLSLLAGSSGITAAIIFGPLAAAWFVRRGHVDGVIRAVFPFTVLLAPACATILVASTVSSTLGATAIVIVTYVFPQGLALTALQLATPNRMRGLVNSLYIFASSVMGLGVAPTLVAVVTEHILRDPYRVQESLGMVCTGAAIGSSLLIFGAIKPFRRALQQQPADSSRVHDPAPSQAFKPETQSTQRIGKAVANG